MIQQRETKNNIIHHVNSAKEKNLDNFSCGYFIYCYKSNHPKTQWLKIIIILYLFAHDFSVWAVLAGDKLLFYVVSFGTRISKKASSVACIFCWDGWNNWGLAKHPSFFMRTFHVASFGFHITLQIQDSCVSYMVGGFPKDQK